MKKIFSFILALVLCCTTLCLTACGDDDSSCSHSYSSWTVTVAATCEGTGTKTRVCSKCGETETKTIAALGHNYVDDVCTVCGKHR